MWIAQNPNNLYTYKDIRAWSVENKLLLNDAKTEVIHISSRFKNPDHLSHVTVGTSRIEIVSEARNLGVVIDDSLQLKQHINNVCRAAMIAIRKIGQIRHYLDKNVKEKLVHAFITSRIDSCNSLLFGLPECSDDRKTSAHSKHGCQTSNTHEEVWTHKPCPGVPALAFRETPNCV